MAESLSPGSRTQSPPLATVKPMRRRDVVFWYAALNPYMAERFSALERLETLDFETWIGRDTNPARAWLVDDTARQFPYRTVPGVTVGSHRIGLPIREMLGVHPRVLISFHADPAVAMGVVQRLHPRCRLLYYVEKTFDTWTPRNFAKEALKRLLFSPNVMFLTPGPDADGYLARYGVGPERIRRLEHAVDYAHLSASRGLRASLRPRREAMGLHGFVFLFLGRVWWQKGIWTLLDAHERLVADGHHVTLLVVGDGPDRDRFRQTVADRRIRGVVMRDFVQQPHLPSILASSDALVFPTRGDPYGLVVDEAMAAGLPVISSTSAGEIRTRVVPGETGLLVEPDDVDGLHAAMRHLQDESERAAAMGDRAAEAMRNRTPERWARQVTDAVRDLVR